MEDATIDFHSFRGYEPVQEKSEEEKKIIEFYNLRKDVYRTSLIERLAFKRCNFTNMHTSRLIFRRCVVMDVVFNKATDFHSGGFHDSNLTKATFNNCEFDHGEIHRSSLTDCTMNSCYGRDLYLLSSRVQGLTYNKCRMDLYLGGTTIQRSIFRDSLMQHLHINKDTVITETDMTGLECRSIACADKPSEEQRKQLMWTGIRVTNDRKDLWSEKTDNIWLRRLLNIQFLFGKFSSL